MRINETSWSVYFCYHFHYTHALICLFWGASLLNAAWNNSLFSVRCTKSAFIYIICILHLSILISLDHSFTNVSIPMNKVAGCWSLLLHAQFSLLFVASLPSTSRYAHYFFRVSLCQYLVVTDFRSTLAHVKMSPQKQVCPLTYAVRFVLWCVWPQCNVAFSIGRFVASIQSFS